MGHEEVLGNQKRVAEVVAENTHVVGELERQGHQGWGIQHRHRRGGLGGFVPDQAVDRVEVEGFLGFTHASILSCGCPQPLLIRIRMSMSPGLYLFHRPRHIAIFMPETGPAERGGGRPNRLPG